MEIARECLLGSWTVTDYGKVVLGADKRGYVAEGGGGGTYTFRRDGTASENHPADRPALTAAGGSRYAVTLTGANTYRYGIRIDRGSLLLDLTRTSGNLRLRITRNGALHQQFPVPAGSDDAIEQFTCAGNRLIFDGIVDTVLTRTTT
ncbi:hypothetical protein [Cryptosporangium aurantiacum]|uniref:hypothetical protein n=1 Tax=Cryptosporangium aurantiacum TaxID=134849 RepID=UPI0011610767|nr:hypothetical protein [Cryptosporangium aurantiacum]